MRDSGYRIAIAERGGFDAQAGDDFDLRVNSINLASEIFLEKIGAWQDALAIRACPFSGIEAWGASGGRIEFRAEEIDEPWLGHIVENAVLLTALTRIARSSDRIDILEGVALRSIRLADDAAIVDFEGGESVQADLVVGADGGDSAVRDAALIGTSERDYRQDAIVAQIETSNPHGNWSYQRFLDTGPLAFLPLSDGSSSIVWSCDRDLAESLMNMSAEEFEDALAIGIDHRLGEMKLLSERITFPLRKLSATSYVSERAVLVGDSAHVIHPLAGMGANLGLMDAATLAELIMKRTDPATDIWNPRVYREYERWRKTANVPVANVMDGFDAGFRYLTPVVPAMSGLGLSIANVSGPIKRTIMRLACGVVGDLPQLARRQAPAD